MSFDPISAIGAVNWKKIGRYRIFWKACKDAEGTP
jgi:hypothetical protein